MLKTLDIAKFKAALEDKGREIAEIEGREYEVGADRPYGQGAPEDSLDPSSSVNMGLLREIDYALERIREGDYGVCENCGKTIKEARLEAIPWARLCLGCERLREEEEEAE